MNRSILRHSLSLFALLLPGAVACTVNSTEAPTPSTPGADAGTTPTSTCTPPTHGPTVHKGDIEGDETWTADASPHIVEGDVNVRDGKKLTIEPCAVVQITTSASINVAFPLTPNKGTLVAEGTAERPIKFEGKDGARWGNVFVNAPGTARFAYTTFEGGGGGDEPTAHATLVATGDGDLPRKPILFVDHVTIKNSRGAGALLEIGAAFTEGSRELTITGGGQNNEFHPYPLEVGESAVDSIPTGTYTGNKTDEILIDPETVGAGGGFQQDTTIHDRGVPYHVGKTPDLDNLHIGNGNRDALLTIEPGVKMRFIKGIVFGVESDDNGTSGLRALGTKEKPIVFTSASATPAPGDWRGFYFNGPIDPRNAMENVHIEYAGSDCSCSMVTCNSGVSEYEAAVIFSQEPKSMFIKDSVIAHSSMHGIVQGYDGLSFDWKSSNTFEDVAGCPVTLARNPDTSCPDPMPPCK